MDFLLISLKMEWWIDFITVHIIIFICGTLLMHNNLEIITPVFFLNLKKKPAY